MLPVAQSVRKLCWRRRKEHSLRLVLISSCGSAPAALRCSIVNGGELWRWRLMKFSSVRESCQVTELLAPVLAKLKIFFSNNDLRNLLELSSVPTILSWAIRRYYSVRTKGRLM